MTSHAGHCGVGGASQRTLVWCRLVEIAPPLSTNDGAPIHDKRVGTTSSSGTDTSLLSSLFLYVQCWKNAASSSLPQCRSKEGVQQVAVKPEARSDVETEGENNGATPPPPPSPQESGHSATDVLQQLSLTSHLYHPGLGLVWKTDVATLEDIRPPYMNNDAAFLRIFDSVFRASTVAASSSVDGCSPSGATFSVYPAILTNETSVVRVDVRMSARGGHASVAICALHCSKFSGSCCVPSPLAAVSELWALMSRDVDRLSAIQTASDAALAAAAVTEQRMVELAKGHQQDQESLLSGFVEVLNQKKSKIRDLTAQVDVLQRRLVELHEEFGSGVASEMEVSTKSRQPPFTGSSNSSSDCDANGDPDVRLIPQGEGTCADDAAVISRQEGRSATDPTRKRSRSSTGSRSGLNASKSMPELSSANSLDQLLQM